MALVTITSCVESGGELGALRRRGTLLGETSLPTTSVQTGKDRGEKGDGNPWFTGALYTTRRGCDCNYLTENKMGFYNRSEWAFVPNV